MWEQYFLYYQKPEYNITPNAGSSLGYKHIDETRRKMSEALIGNQRTLGYKHTEEARQRMSEAHKNPSLETRRKNSKIHMGKRNHMYGKKHTKETRLKMSRTQKIRWRKEKEQQEVGVRG